jgi:tRNA modification GTPase
LVESDAAITAPLAGTTRDVLTRPVALGGIPFVFIDMAGLRDEAADPVEQLGIARARAAIGGADLVLWLGPEGEGPDGCWEIDARCDRADRAVKRNPRLVLSALTGEGMEALRRALIDHAAQAMPRPGQTVLSARQRESVASGAGALRDAAAAHDPLIVAEHLRHARLSFDRITGRAGTEDMLDALFGRFCIGK